MRAGFDRNSKDSNEAAKFSQFDEGISVGFWLVEEKQLKNERDLR